MSAARLRQMVISCVREHILLFANLLCCLGNESIDAFGFEISTLLADLAYRLRAIALDLSVSARLTCQCNSLALSGSLVAIVLSAGISILHVARESEWGSTARIAPETIGRMKICEVGRLPGSRQ
jgi:hypothetical protein